MNAAKHHTIEENLQTYSPIPILEYCFLVLPIFINCAIFLQMELKSPCILFIWIVVISNLFTKKKTQNEK